MSGKDRLAIFPSRGYVFYLFSYPLLILAKEVLLSFLATDKKTPNSLLITLHLPVFTLQSSNANEGSIGWS